MKFIKANKLYFKDKKGSLKRLDKVSPRIYYYVYMIFSKGYGSVVYKERKLEHQVLSKHVRGTLVDVVLTDELVGEFEKKIGQNFITIYNNSINSELCHLISPKFEEERQKKYFVHEYIEKKKPTQELTWWARLIKWINQFLS